MNPISIQKINLTTLAFVAALAVTASANGPRDLFSSSAAQSHGGAVAQRPAHPLIKQLPTHSIWSNDAIIYDNGGPNQTDGNEMTEWIQAEDFNLSAASTLGAVNFWDIEAPGGASYQGEIDWTLYADAGGMPGASFASGAAVGGAVTRTFLQSGVLGFFDEYSNSFNISPGVALTAGTTYWLGLHNGPLTFTTRSEFYWETTNPNGTFTGHEDDAPYDGVWFDNFMQHAFNLSDTGGGGRGHCGVPMPAPASFCATLAIQPIPPVDDQPFVSPTTINGFVFTSLGGSPIYNVEFGTLLGLRFDPLGLTIRLPKKSRYAMVELGVLSTDVVVEGFDIGGTKLFSVKVPHTGISTTMVTVSGPNLETIALTEGQGEGVVFSICAWN
jgi:hypothetical protein